MAWSFGDGFDLYSSGGDAINGYWDSGTTVGFSLVSGRFTGSQAIQQNSSTVWLVKSSGVNDAVHHLVVAFRQTSAISGSTLGTYLQLLDGTTGQCCIVFRGDGAILLTSGTPGGTTLATYTSAFPVSNTWYAFEFEIVINNTTGSFAVRKNGNTSNDFSATSLNTRPGSNSYANKLQVGQNAAVAGQQFDDLFWRSDASSVAWMGDIRCYTRMPASDQSVQFSRAPTTVGQTFTSSATSNISVGVARYTPFTPAYDGTVGSVILTLAAGYTGNMKCSMFASSGTAPTTVLGSATAISNPVSGSNTFTFGTPVAVADGVQYWVGFDSDTNVTNGWQNTTGTPGATSTTSYALFPVASPVVTTGQTMSLCTINITVTSNCSVVNEAQQDAATSYVYSSTPGQSDLYGISSIASTPVSTIAVTTRSYAIKSDAGTRTMNTALKSGATTVNSPTFVLTTSNWTWIWRTDITDPATGSPWTAVAVNTAQIGVTVVA